MTVPKLLSVKAVHEHTTLPISTLYDLIAKGELPVVRIGKAVRIDEDDLVRFIRSRREQSG